MRQQQTETETETNIMAERKKYIIRQDIQDAYTLRALKTAVLEMFDHLDNKT